MKSLALLLFSLVATQSRTTKNNLKIIIEKAFESPDEHSGFLALVSKAVKTRRNQRKLESYFKPARKIQPKQVQAKPPNQTHQYAKVAEVKRPKRKSVLLDVRIPSVNDVQPEHLSTALHFQAPDLSTPLSVQLLDPPNSPPSYHPYLSTLYLSEVPTVSPTGLKTSNSNINQKNLSSFNPEDPHISKQEDIKAMNLNEINTVDENDIHDENTRDTDSENNETDLSSEIPKDISNDGKNIIFDDPSDITTNNPGDLEIFEPKDLTVEPGDLTTPTPTDLTTAYSSENSIKNLDSVGTSPAVTPSFREPRENNLASSQTTCYTHTMTWLGRCVVLCDKVLVRPCVFHIGD